MGEGPNGDYRYDLFISYRHHDPDKQWVRGELAPALRARGLRLCIDESCFRLGHPILREMERAVVESRCTLSVLTPAYELSGFTDLERIMAQHLDAEQRQLRWLAVILEEVPMRLLDRYRLALDMTDPSAFGSNVAALVSAVASAAD